MRLGLLALFALVPVFVAFSITQTNITCIKVRRP